MPMELRKRKAPANPLPPAPPKKAKSEGTKKKGVAAKAKAAAATVKKTVEEKVEEVIRKPEEKKEEENKEKKEEQKSADKPEEKPEEKPVVAEDTSNAAPSAAPAKKGKAKAPAKNASDAKAAEKPVETKLKVGDVLPTEMPEIQLDDGKTTTFSSLLDASDKGIVIFSYTKASTGGCTSQACAMRDNLTLFTGAGWSVYGLSADSVTANSNWKTKQKLNYPLISDTSLKFHEKLGIKKNGKGSRNVIVIQKEGKFIKELKSVTPAASLEVAKSAAGISGAKKDLVTTPVATDEKSEAKPGEATS